MSWMPTMSAHTAEVLVATSPPDPDAPSKAPRTGRGGPCASAAPPAQAPPARPALCTDESDYLTDCEEVLLDSPPDACTGSQHTAAGLGSDSVSCGAPWPAARGQPSGSSPP